MCILDLSKIPMYQFRCDYIKNKHEKKSKPWTVTDSLTHEIKILAAIKKMFDFRNYLTKSKYYDNSNKLVIGKMKDETGGIAIEEFLGLKPKINLFLVDNSQYKKAKGVNRNNVATVSHNEYKDALWKNKDTQWIEFKVKTIE